VRHAPTLLLFLLLGCPLAGCAAPRLADERVVQPFAGLLAKGDTQGAVSRRINAAPAGARPLELNVVQMPKVHRGSGPLLVLQSGVLADSSTWRFLAPLLAEDYDLLLIDPPGCGASMKPKIQTLGEDGYTPTWIGQHTLRAVARWEQANDLPPRPLVFVGHSLGSAAVLMALGDRETSAAFPALRERVQKIVLVQPADVGMVHTNRNFKTLAKLPDPLVHVGSALGVTGYVVKDVIYESVVNPRERAHRQEAESFEQVISQDDTRHAAQAMLRRFRKTDAEGNPDWLYVQEHEQRYRYLPEPILIIWGDKGEVLEPHVPGRLQKKLPDVRVRHVEDAKHSPHQERPALCARWIRAFLEEGREGE
jgi:pimeloyl-ACP methyl ester carboxylesterase